MGFKVFNFWLLLFFATSCSKNENNGSLPIFIEIEEFSLKPDAKVDDSNIKGAWCFVEDEFVGYYPLPNILPIFARETVNISLLPGIYANGIAATPEDYPFYQPHEFAVDPFSFTPLVIKPQTKYKDNTKFSLIEDFENGQTYFTKSLNESPIDHFVIQQEVVFEGGYAGKIELNQEKNNSIEIATSKRWSSTSLGKNDVYLEVQYLTDVPIIFGLVGFTRPEEENGFPLYQFGVNPSENWNKIYIKLDELLVDSDIQAYSICFSANLEGYGWSKADIFLDNIKLIHF